MLRCDLHVHSNFSCDGVSSVEEILLTAQKKKLDAIAITDHDTTAGARYALEVAPKVAPGLIVIPGAEVTTKSGHLLVLGITEDIRPRMSVMDTLTAAKALGATVIVPHPDHRLRHGMRIPMGADAVEIYNSRFLLGYHNGMARRRARTRSLPGVAGTDAHIASLVGTAVTEIDAPYRTYESVLQAIREGKTTISVRKTPVRVYMGQISHGWVRRVKSFLP